MSAMAGVIKWLFQDGNRILKYILFVIIPFLMDYLIKPPNNPQ